MAKRTSNIGRPPVGKPRQGEKAAIAARLTPEMKTLLNASAARSGRSLSNEIEARLEMSFHREGLLEEGLALRFGRDVAGLLLLLGTTMQIAGEVAGFAWLLQTKDEDDSWAGSNGSRWIGHPWPYDQARRAAARLLDRLRPTGEVGELHDYQGGVVDSGEMVAHVIADFVQSGKLPDDDNAKNFERLLREHIAPLQPMLTRWSSHRGAGKEPGSA